MNDSLTQKTISFEKYRKKWWEIKSDGNQPIVAIVLFSSSFPRYLSTPFWRGTFRHSLTAHNRIRVCHIINLAVYFQFTKTKKVPRRRFWPFFLKFWVAVFAVISLQKLGKLLPNSVNIWNINIDACKCMRKALTKVFLNVKHHTAKATLNPERQKMFRNVAI